MPNMTKTKVYFQSRDSVISHRYCRLLLQQRSADYQHCRQVLDETFKNMDASLRRRSEIKEEAHLRLPNSENDASQKRFRL